MSGKSCGNCGNCDGWYDEGYGVGEYICIIDQDGKDHPELECDENGDCPMWRPITEADLERAGDNDPAQYLSDGEIQNIHGGERLTQPRYPKVRMYELLRAHHKTSRKLMAHVKKNTDRTYRTLFGMEQALVSYLTYLDEQYCLGLSESDLSGIAHDIMENGIDRFYLPNPPYSPVRKQGGCKNPVRKTGGSAHDAEYIYSPVRNRCPYIGGFPNGGKTEGRGRKAPVRGFLSEGRIVRTAVGPIVVD